MRDLPHVSLASWAKTCLEVQWEILDGSKSGTTVRAKQCCFCNELKRLGAGAHDNSLIQHMLSKKCRKIQRSMGNPLPPVTSDEPKFRVRSTRRSGVLPIDPNFSDLQPLDDHSSFQRPLVASTSSLPIKHEQDSSLPVPVFRSPSPDTKAFVFDTLKTHEESNDCPGALVQFGGNMFMDYPWQLHAQGHLPYRLSYIDPSGQSFRAQSLKCSGSALAKGEPCDACSRVVISKRFEDVLQRATLESSSLPSNLAFQYRTHSQLCDLLRKKTSQSNAYKFKATSAQRKLESLSRRMPNSKQLASSTTDSKHNLGVQPLKPGPERKRAASESELDLNCYSHVNKHPRL